MIKNHSKLSIKNSTLPTVGIERFVEWYREFYGDKHE